MNKQNISKKKISKTICDSLNHTRLPVNRITYQTERVGTTKLQKGDLVDQLSETSLSVYWQITTEVRCIAVPSLSGSNCFVRGTIPPDRSFSS